MKRKVDWGRDMVAFNEWARISRRLAKIHAQTRIAAEEWVLSQMHRMGQVQRRKYLLRVIDEYGETVKHSRGQRDYIQAFIFDAATKLLHEMIEKERVKK